MRAQSDAAGMAEQVQAYRSKLIPVYRKSCLKKKIEEGKEDEGEEKKVGSWCPEQS